MAAHSARWMSWTPWDLSCTPSVPGVWWIWPYNPLSCATATVRTEHPRCRWRHLPQHRQAISRSIEGRLCPRQRICLRMLGPDMSLQIGKHSPALFAVMENSWTVVWWADSEIRIHVLWQTAGPMPGPERAGYGMLGRMQWSADRIGALCVRKD